MHDGEHNIPGIKMNAAVKASVRPIRRVPFYDRGGVTGNN